MPEELQSLLDRIQKDGVEKADAEAARVTASAREEARAILKQAEEKAGTALSTAEKEAQAFAERARSSLQQAARDVVIYVGQAVNSVMRELVAREVAAALTQEELKQMLVTIVESYCRTQANGTRTDILVPRDQHKALADFFLSRFSEEARRGIEIKGDDTVVSGFKVVVVDQKVEHDFSGGAIAEALCELLRPELAEIVRAALASQPA